MMSAAPRESYVARLMRSRDLARTLITRELVVRYKRSVLGVGWGLVEPLANVAVYIIVFGVFLDAGVGTDDYAVFALWGVLPWLFFSSTLDQATNTLLEHAPLLKKAAFPRELLVLAVVLSRATTLLLGATVAVVVTLVRGVPFGIGAAGLLVCGIVLLTLLSGGIALVLSAIQVLLRDTAFLVRFVLRLGFYACPVVYPLSRVPADMREIYELNPLVPIFWCFQASAAPAAAQPSMQSIVVCVVVVVIASAGGLSLFHRMMPAVADRL